MELHPMTIVRIGAIAMTIVAGFVVWSNACFFKNMSCGNDIINGTNTVLYIKQGGFEQIDHIIYDNLSV